jgi:capsular polysaccharide biosynthesis protein
LLSDLRNAAVFREASRLPADLSRYVNDQAAILESPTILESAVSALPDLTLARTLEDGLVTATPESNQDVIIVSARGESAEQAVALANAVVDAYEDHILDSVAESAAEALAELQRLRDASLVTIDELEERLAANAEDLDAQLSLEQELTRALSLKQRMDSVRVDVAAFGSGIDLFEPARVDQVLADGPTQPTPVSFGLLGAFLLAGATGLAIAVREYVRPTIHTPGDITRHLDLRQLAVLADRPEVSSTTALEADSVIMRGAGAISASLTTRPDGAEIGSIVVSGTHSADVRGAVAVGIALDQVRLGAKTLLVQMDPDYRNLETFFPNLSSGDGTLTSVDVRDGRSLSIALGVLPEAPSKYDRVVVIGPDLERSQIYSLVAGHDFLVAVVPEGADANRLVRLLADPVRLARNGAGFVFVPAGSSRR